MAAKNEADKPVTHNLQFYRGAVDDLKEMLKQPSWYKDDIEKLTEACMLLESELLCSHKAPVFEGMKVSEANTDAKRAEYAEKFDKWQKEVLEPWKDEWVTYEASEAEREAMKSCVGWFRKEARLAPSKYTLNLLRQLGFTSK